jgi:hypothetical protein
VLVGEIDAARVAPIRVQVGWSRHARVRASREGLRGGDRIFQQALEGHRGIDDLVHERGVGAVLEEPAHEIGEQRLVGAHGGVDAAGQPEILRPDHLVVERLAHAVQALELEVAVPARDLHDLAER